MDTRIKFTPPSFETSSGSNITTTTFQGTGKRSKPCHSPDTFEPPKAKIKTALCQQNEDPPLAPTVAVLTQTKIPTPAPPDRTHSLPDSGLSRRSAALNPASPLHLNTLPKQCNFLQMQLLSCYLEVPLVISDPEVFSKCMKNGSGMNHQWIVQHTHTSVLRSMLSAEIIGYDEINVDDIPVDVLTPELALACLKECHSWCYEPLPARLKTPEFNQMCLEAGVLPACLLAETALPSREVQGLRGPDLAWFTSLFQYL